MHEESPFQGEKSPEQPVSTPSQAHMLADHAQGPPGPGTGVGSGDGPPGVAQVPKPPAQSGQKAPDTAAFTFSSNSAAGGGKLPPRVPSVARCRSEPPATGRWGEETHSGGWGDTHMEGSAREKKG